MRLPHLRPVLPEGAIIHVFCDDDLTIDTQLLCCPRPCPNIKDVTRIKSRQAAMMRDGMSKDGAAAATAKKHRSSMVLDPTVVPSESLTQDYLHAARNLHKYAERYSLQANAMRVKCKTIAANIEATSAEEAQMTSVDFDKLKINNIEYRRVLDDRQSEVAKLKVAVGHRTIKVQATRDIVDRLDNTTIELKRE